jgi:hypothetical protein
MTMASLTRMTIRVICGNGSSARHIRTNHRRTRGGCCPGRLCGFLDIQAEHCTTLQFKSIITDDVNQITVQIAASAAWPRKFREQNGANAHFSVACSLECGAFVGRTMPYFNGGWWCLLSSACSQLQAPFKWTRWSGTETPIGARTDFRWPCQ